MLIPANCAVTKTTCPNAARHFVRQTLRFDPQQHRIFHEYTRITNTRCTGWQGRHLDGCQFRHWLRHSQVVCERGRETGGGRTTPAPARRTGRLRKEGTALVYRCAKQRSEPTSDKRGAKVDEITLSPLELIARIAALVPPPRTHRHRYFGVLAPKSSLRAAAVALAAPAQPAKQVVVQTEPAATDEVAPAVVPHEPVPPKRAPAHYLWAVLIARIYEVFPLLCPKCGGQMRLIAFITEGMQIRKILDHIGVDSEPPHISPARGPALWDDCSDAQTDEGVHIEPDWDLAAQAAPDFEVDQRISW